MEYKKLDKNKYPIPPNDEAGFLIQKIFDAAAQFLSFENTLMGRVQLIRLCDETNQVLFDNSLDAKCKLQNIHKDLDVVLSAYPDYHPEGKTRLRKENFHKLILTAYLCENPELDIIEKQYESEEREKRESLDLIRKKELSNESLKEEYKKLFLDWSEVHHKLGAVRQKKLYCLMFGVDAVAIVESSD